MRIDTFLSIGLWGGMALVVLAWFKVILREYGWLVFAIVVPSFIVETILKKRVPPSDRDDNSG